MPQDSEFSSALREARSYEHGSAPASVICASALAASAAVKTMGLLGLCHAYHEVSRSIEGLPFASDRELRKLLDCKYAVIRDLAAVEAKTPYEIMAKAKIVQPHLEHYLKVHEGKGDDPEIQLALSLARDVRALA